MSINNLNVYFIVICVKFKLKNKSTLALRHIYWMVDQYEKLQDIGHGKLYLSNTIWFY